MLTLAQVRRRLDTREGRAEIGTNVGELLDSAQAEVEAMMADVTKASRRRIEMNRRRLAAIERRMELLRQADAA